MTNLLKPLKFLGSSKDDLLAMPDTVRHAVGVELMVVQFGGTPSDFKPMPVVGQGHTRFGCAMRLVHFG